MRRILITYGDQKFVNSLWLLKLSAKKPGMFDSIKVYTPKDLPSSIASSPLMLYSRGGGYWIWKPYIISHTLKEMQEGDVLYYLDAGCTINSSSQQWTQIDDLMEKHNALFFQYRSDYDYQWSRWGVNSPAIKHWTKASTLRYLDELLGTCDYHTYNKVWGGFMVIKKGVAEKIIDEWLEITLFHPDLVIDPLCDEVMAQSADFNAHRHDQPIITALVYKYKDILNLAVEPEMAESSPKTAAVASSRYRVGKMSWWKTLKFRAFHLMCHK